MRAFDPEVVDAVWAAIEPLLPVPAVDVHPLGCHRPRVADRLCFEGILIRLVTGLRVGRRRSAARRSRCRTRRCAPVATSGSTPACSTRWPTRRSPRTTGSSVSTSASARSTAANTRRRPAVKAPARTPSIGAARAGSGRCSPTATASRSAGPPTGANRNDCILLAPTLADVVGRGLLADIETLHLDRGYDNRNVRRLVAVGRHHRSRVQPTAATRHRDHQEARPARPALADRTDQQLAVELRATPPQHRPAHPSPARSTRPRDRCAPHRQTHRLAQPMEPGE